MARRSFGFAKFWRLENLVVREELLVCRFHKSSPKVQKKNGKGFYVEDDASVMHDGSSDYACNGWTSLFPAFSLLSSSWIPISPFSESASILHLILPLILPSPYFSPALVPHAFLQTQTIHEDRHASILAKNRNNNKKKLSKNSLAESPSINPHNNPITRRKRIPLFEFAHVFKPLQIQSDTCAFMVLCMEWNLLAVGHCGKRCSKVVMVKMTLSRRSLVGLMDGWRKNMENDRVAQICLGSRNSKKPDHTARLK